jgi:uncharacterized membrane protein YgcG
MGKDGAELFTQDCAEANDVHFAYSIFTMLAMLLYFALLIDLAVLSTKVSAYCLVCIRMISEVGLFILALFSAVLMFSSAVSVIEHEQIDFAGIHKGLLTFFEVTMRMFDGSHYEMYESDPLVLVCTFAFIILVLIFLANMLVAQLTCAYEAVYIDMLGYARLERMDIIVNTMPAVSEKSWLRFNAYLGLDKKIEFGAGDVGVAGGLQILEPANANPTTSDMIKRFGGSTSPDMLWPADEAGEGDEDDRFERIENLIQKTLKRITKGGGSKGKSGSSGQGSAGQSGSNSGGGSGDGGSAGSEGAEDA